MTRSRRRVRRVYCGSWCSHCNPSIRSAQRERIAIAEARCDAIVTEAQLRADAVDAAQDETIPDSAGDDA